MSLSTTPTVQQYALAVLASKDFDSRDLLDDTLGPKLAQIRQLLTNGANGLVCEWALTNGVPYSVIPIQGRGLPASTRDIVDAAEVVLIIASAGSKSAGQVAAICVAKAKRDAAFKWRQQVYEPIDYWRGKVGKVSEIMACLNRDELAANAWAQSVWKEIA